MATARRWRVRVFSGVAALCLTAGGFAAWAQSPAVKPPSDTAEAGTVAKGETSDPRAKLIADTRRMVALSREVQVEMAKSAPDTLSLGVVKKVEELQRLAASVKAEMTKLP